MKHLQIVGAVFTLLLGTLLHFSYDWSGGNTIVGIFSATNESTWEHLKLLAMPVFLFAIMEYFAYGRLVPNFIPVKLLSILLGMAAIVVSFYSYLGVIGQHFLWADIATFFFGVIISYWFSFRFLLRNDFTSVVAVRFAWAGFLLLFACFALFTFYPPQIALFLDPSS